MRPNSTTFQYHGHLIRRDEYGFWRVYLHTKLIGWYRCRKDAERSVRKAEVTS
jgi:hypothetical protein